MIRLDFTGVMFPEGDAQEAAGLKALFASQQAVRLPNLLSPRLLRFFQEAVEGALTHEFRGEKQSKELRLPPDAPLRETLHFMMNDPALLGWVETFTGCPRLGCFLGRIYQAQPAPEFVDQWHDDVIHGREVGISINLGSTAFAGGAFRLQEKASQRTLFECRNTGAGDAMLFRIGPLLAHRVDALEGEVARTVLTGWFCLEPDLRASGPGTGAGTPRGAGPAAAGDSIPARVRLSPATFVRRKAGGTLIHSAATAATCRLDEIGSEIFDLFLEHGAAEPVVQRLAARYEAPLPELRRAALDLAQGLVARGVFEAS